ncbi:hypothetical protein CYMTET_44113 [Cymbomonas tetramitiformis]|uniref:Uncharacterized protein n=1 Tax=Cymbomonas tetramitiformis TaxID=36881 RepID=A0AAE0C237_9CHLO|nr:hypothetical protein CYMTET_44113 [Cymbomonas tetramitiformis]
MVYTETRNIDTSAYCSCGKCCGWEWGAALGPLPIYLPLSLQKLASGHQCLPLIPRRRRCLKDNRKDEPPPGWKLKDRLRGAAVGPNTLSFGGGLEAGHVGPQVGSSTWALV